MTRLLRIVALLFASVVVLGCAIWAIGALSFDLPVLRTAGASVFTAGVIAALIFIRDAWRKLAVVMLGVALVLIWWRTLKPSNDRQWQPDVARTGWAEVHGDIVTLHNVRNCDYRTETDYTPRWETRTVRLSQLTGVDLAIDYWGSPYIAHPIVSFQFAEGLPICFSIETRKETGENYSAIGGLYRQYELIYIVADERDVFRVRTNYRKGEDLYLYRLTMSPEHARQRFLEYVATLNELHQKPRWYNAITNNCTTSIRTQHPAARRTPWDWRILVNGKGDEMLFESGAIVTDGLNFADLKKQALINPAAQAANDAPDFSSRIREGRRLMFEGSSTYPTAPQRLPGK